MLVFNLARQEKGLHVQKRLRASVPNETTTLLLPSEQVRCRSKERFIISFFMISALLFLPFTALWRSLLDWKICINVKVFFFPTDLDLSFQAQHWCVGFGFLSLLWEEWPSGHLEKVELTVGISNPYKGAVCEKGSQDLPSFASRTLLWSFSDHWQLKVTFDGSVRAYERECGLFIPLVMGW